MKDDEFIIKRDGLVNDFKIVFERLLAGGKFDLYTANVSPMFEVIATNLLADNPDRKFMWYDGVENLAAMIRKPRQVEFTGDMWIGDIGDGKKQWKEEFRARVTDKRVTEQGIWITLRIGPSRADGELSAALGSVPR